MRDCFYCKYCNLREKSIFINFARNKNLKNGGNCVCEIFQPLKVPKFHPWIERFFQISNLIGKVGVRQITFVQLCRFGSPNISGFIFMWKEGTARKLLYDAIASLDFSFHTSDHVPHTKQVHTQPLLNPSPVKHQMTVKFT